ncbi:hypothetical protein E2C01_008016 [Portunus trituberculatus]|uniref:Uncharacterized protein n=1 Tax=Portunus trituberculatus TaxID=210409 RepID=A0A5B7D1Z3_PORTR|nr:hypothetical protein [Portunus trituberculatus]
MLGRGSWRAARNGANPAPPSPPSLSPGAVLAPALRRYHRALPLPQCHEDSRSRKQTSLAVKLPQRVWQRGRRSGVLKMVSGLRCPGSLARSDPLIQGRITP